MCGTWLLTLCTTMHVIIYGECAHFGMSDMVIMPPLSILQFYKCIQGLFRISCEDILRILRRGRETLLTLLEAFVYDPLIDWTQSEDAAFPLAVRASKGITAGRPSREEMERAVASPPTTQTHRMRHTTAPWGGRGEGEEGNDYVITELGNQRCVVNDYTLTVSKP